MRRSQSMEGEGGIATWESAQYNTSGTASSRTSDADSMLESSASSPLFRHDNSFDWVGREKQKLQEDLRPMTRARRRRSFVYIAIITLAGVCAVVQASIYLRSRNGAESLRRENGQRRLPYFTEKYISRDAGPGTFPLNLQNVMPGDICSICDCHASPAFYAPAKSFLKELPPRPLQKHVYPSQDSIDTNEFMRQTILDIYCARQHMDPLLALKLLRRTRNLSELMSWSLTGLEFGKPTIYLTTATSPIGKAGPLRPQYFRRSGRAIRSWIAQQEKEAKNQHPGWQVVWIVAEDDIDIDPLVARTLRRTGISYIYFAYGMTQQWGNAQKNAAMQVVYALSRPDERGGLFGPGPVYGLDDDNKIQPDLLSLIIQVQRVGVIGMGNLGEDMWERPVLNELGEIIESESLWQDGRKFPFDFGSFTFNSTLLGTSINGPMFWKHTEFAGETEFLDQFVNNIRDLEPLCARQNQECYVVWHNEPLLELEKMTDDEEIEYVKKFGADHLFEMLGMQAIEFENSKIKNYEPPPGDEE